MKNQSCPPRESEIYTCASEDEAKEKFIQFEYKIRVARAHVSSCCNDIAQKL